jgi:hypothetical protein
MAEIVGSLFGITADQYERNLAAQDQARAIQMASLAPGVRGSAMIQAGAAGLGRGIGSLLGAQDPQLQIISARNQIARQIDPSNPESFMSAAQMLAQMGDTQGATALADAGRKAQAELALVGQRNAAAQASVAQATRERAAPAAPTTSDLTNARAIAALAGPEGSPEYNAAFRAEYARLTAPKDAKGPGFGADREAVAAEVFDKPFAQLTPTERAVVNSRVNAEGTTRAKATATTVVLPGDKALVDIPGFRAKVQSTIDPQAKAVFAADNALTNIQDSIDTGNFASYRAAQVQFAKAIAGAGDLSQKELKAAGADPALLGGTADYISTLFSSTPTLDTQNKIKRTLQAIKKVSTDKANAEIESQRRIALRNKNYDPAAVNEALSFPEFSAAPAAGGGTLAEQAAAELKRRQGARPTAGGR